jgi:hypothetical protein
VPPGQGRSFANELSYLRKGAPYASCAHCKFPSTLLDSRKLEDQLGVDTTELRGQLFKYAFLVTVKMKDFIFMFLKPLPKLFILGAKPSIPDPSGFAILLLAAQAIEADKLS